MLVALQPLFSLVLGFFFLKEGLRRSAVIGCMIAIIGCFVIGWGDFQVSGLALFGDILALIVAGVISLYFFVGQIVRKDTGVLTYSVLSYFSGVVFLFIYAVIKHNHFTGYTASTWGAFLGLALISTIGSQFVFNLLLKNVSASVVTMTILGEPIGTCILAYFILKEAISGWQFVGISIILARLAIFFFAPLLKENKA